MRHTKEIRPKKFWGTLHSKIKILPSFSQPLHLNKLHLLNYCITWVYWTMISFFRRINIHPLDIKQVLTNFPPLLHAITSEQWLRSRILPQNLMNDIRWYLRQQILGMLRVQGLSSRCALIKATTPAHIIQIQYFTVNAQWDCSAGDIAIELRQWKKATARFRKDPLADIACEKNSQMTGRRAEDEGASSDKPAHGEMCSCHTNSVFAKRKRF